MGLSSPEPSVRHLLTLFRNISNGEIRVPAFQREFVWKEKQILELLASVRAGFPVGSILTWYVEKPLLKIASSGLTAFPSVPEKYPTSYVLDGMQRLSSLYGVFHFGDSTTDPQFDVWFDLRGSHFRLESDLDMFEKQSAVPLAALFVPKALLKHQADLAALPDGDVLIDRLLELQSSFQDYMIPVVQIRGEDVGPIVAIFEKINSTGTPLSAVDFMRAITWSDEFDLSVVLSDLTEWIEGQGQSFPAESIVKCIAMTLDVEPSSEAILALRTKSAMELQEAVSRFRDGYSRTSAFLRDRLSMFAGSLLPYEGQMLVLFRAIGLDNPTPEEVAKLERWLWAVSFNESLRGKPDHYAVRAVNNWRGTITGQTRGLEPRLRLSPADFRERRLIKGKALSSAVMMMFERAEARALGDGDLIDPVFFLFAGGTDGFEPILSLDQLEDAGIAHTGSAKLLANVIASTPWVEDRVPISTHINDLLLAENWNVLSSQFISKQAAEALRDGRYADFLAFRSQSMHMFAAALVGEPHA